MPPSVVRSGMVHDYEKRDGEYVCVVCERAFESEDELQEHVHEEGQMT